MTEGARTEGRGVGGKRHRHAAPWIAWSLCAANVLVLTLALTMVLLGWSTGLSPKASPWWEHFAGVVVQMGAPVLGALIASRRPGNPYGWLWLGYGTGFALSSFGDAYIAYASVAPDWRSLPVPWTILLTGNLGWGVSLVLIPFLLLLFPDGRLPSPRWRIVAWTAALTGTMSLLLAAFLPISPDSPLAIGGEAGRVIEQVIFAGVVVIFTTIVLSAISLVVRYRRASGVQCQQLKWFAYAATLLGAWIVADVGDWFGLSEAVLGELLLSVLTLVSFTALYVAVGIAVLRYRLYDIDVVINRTLVYGTLTLTLVACYLGAVVVLQRALAFLTGQESTLAVVASTLLIAALVAPMRRRVQSFVDRRFYRKKYDARKTLEAFSATLRDETDLETLNDDLVGVVEDTMQPEHVSVWLCPDPATETNEAKNSG